MRGYQIGSTNCWRLDTRLVRECVVRCAHLCPRWRDVLQRLSALWRHTVDVTSHTCTGSNSWQQENCTSYVLLQLPRQMRGCQIDHSSRAPSTNSSLLATKVAREGPYCPRLIAIDLVYVVKWTFYFVFNVPCQVFYIFFFVARYLFFCIFWGYLGLKKRFPHFFPSEKTHTHSRFVKVSAVAN